MDVEHNETSSGRCHIEESGTQEDEAPPPSAYTHADLTVAESRRRTASLALEAAIARDPRMQAASFTVRRAAPRVLAQAELEMERTRARVMLRPDIRDLYRDMVMADFDEARLLSLLEVPS